ASLMAKRRLAVSAVVLNASGEILLVKQGERRFDWELPGGRVGKREPLLDALAREVAEETGIPIVAERLLGVFDIPARRFCEFVFLARPAAAAPAPRPRPPEI